MLRRSHRWLLPVAGPIWLPIPITSLPSDTKMYNWASDRDLSFGGGFAWSRAHVNAVVSKLGSEPRTLEGLVPRPSQLAARSVLAHDVRVRVCADGSVALRPRETLCRLRESIPIGKDNRIPVAKIAQRLAVLGDVVPGFPWTDVAVLESIAWCQFPDVVVEGTDVYIVEAAPDPEVQALFEKVHENSLPLTAEDFEALAKVPQLALDQHLMYTDASKSGWGVVHTSPRREGVLSGMWGDGFLMRPQVDRELMAVVHGVLHGLTTFTDIRTISVLCDNIDVVDLFMGRKSLRPTVFQAEIRDELKMIVAAKKTHLELVWIPGRYNLADAPSRLT